MKGNGFWAHFLQTCLIVSMLRRYGAQAKGILNCDIDELAVPLGSRTVFETANASLFGTVYFRSAWVQPVPLTERQDGYRHSDFRQLGAGEDYRTSPLHKWALVPKRRWLQQLKVHPYTHLIRNRLPFSRHKPGDAFIAHFKAISTGWKYERPVTLSQFGETRRDAQLDGALDKAFPEQSATPVLHRVAEG